MLRAFAIIPARAGSKGVENKNFRNFKDGKSLVERVIEVSQQADFFEAIILTSDHPSAPALCDVYGIDFHRRSEQAGSDTATATDVLIDIKQRLASMGVTGEDYIFYLQPTSPSRSSSLLRDAWIKVSESNLDGLISVVESKVPRQKLLGLRGSKIIAEFSDEEITSNRQNFEPSYMASGDFFCFRWSRFLSNQVFPILNLPAQVVPQAVDIDLPTDFAIAQMSPPLNLD